MRGLAGKRVLVTGGASGIGLATAERFAAEGARVAVVDRSEDRLEATRLAHPDWCCVLGDVSEPSDVQWWFAKLDERWGSPEVLVNNAGISVRHAFLDVSPQEWRAVVATNLDGAFWVAQAAARRMWERRAGVIVHVGSVNGMMGFPRYAAYNSAKAGLIELGRTMALELAPHLRVNVVCPGYVLTAMQRAEYTEPMLAACADKVPLRRLGQPEEIAAMIAFLSSDEASWVTGQSFVIDGGEIAGGLCSQ